MSEVVRAMREAEGFVVACGFRPEEIGSNVIARDVFEVAFTSIMQDGLDTVQPTVLDVGMIETKEGEFNGNSDRY